MSTTTTNLNLNEPSYNQTSPTWDQPLNNNTTILDAAFGNTTSIALTNANVTLTSTQLQVMQVKFTGAISANIIVTVPAIGGRWSFTNATSGAYTVTIASAGAGTSVVAPQGYSTLMFSDATNIVLADGGVISGGNLATLNVSGNSVLGATGTTTTNVGGQLSIVNSTSQLSVVTDNIAEITTVVASGATGTINYDITTQSVLYYTVNSSSNFTLNFRASSGTTLNTALAVGQAVTVAFLNTNGTTGYYNNAVTVDGASVTPKWINGAAPTTGYSNSIDTYTYTIIKTASATYTILATLAKFA